MARWCSGTPFRAKQSRFGVKKPGGLAIGGMRRLCRLGPNPLWWPDILQELTLGVNDVFDDIDIILPASLQKLSFGPCFNQPITGGVWPASLQQLSFGAWFNQPIAGVAWPSSLQKLYFGYRFNEPIDGVMWPASLQQLVFGSEFNRPIAEVLWPASLQLLTVGGRISRPTQQDKLANGDTLPNQAELTIQQINRAGRVVDTWKMCGALEILERWPYQ